MSTASTVIVAPKSPIELHYEKLHGQCGLILSSSVSGANGTKLARSHQLVQEVELWIATLPNRKETALLRIAAHEYQFALLALAQGHYRQAFKGLRLVLELTLQSAHLSTHELELREWLENRKDTVWGVLVDKENGVLSARFARSFFPALEPHVAYHRALAEQVYRECSECVHGNIPKHVPLPDFLALSGPSFDLWHAKADIVALLFHFALTMRYLQEIPINQVPTLVEALIARLGHVQEVRIQLGGPS